MLRFGSFVAAAVLALGLVGMFDTASAQTPDPRNWRQVDPENTLYIDTVHGRIVIELYPEIAPRHVERIKALTRLGFYDGLMFHRVIDVMAQTGIRSVR
jgi:peptidylprolyl isomerase